MENIYLDCTYKPSTVASSGSARTNSSTSGPNTDKSEPQANFELLRNNLLEKSAHTVLKNLIELLEDPAPDSRSSSRALDYL